MRWFGKLFRYFLDINVIWGLMIVIAFLLAVVQNYIPTSTSFESALLRDGENKIAMIVTDKDSKDVPTEFTVPAKAGILDIPTSATKPDGAKPYLIGATTGRTQTTLKWDAKGYGPYRVTVNGKQVAKGRLVTLGAMTDAAFDYAEKAFKLGLGLVSTMVLFLGLMKVGEAAGIVQFAARIFRPVIRFLFPDVPADHPANGAILMNITTAVLGLANAATPFAIKAMQELQKLNPNKKIASDSMVMFLGWNTAGLALLSTTLIAVRKSAGMAKPLDIIGPCIVAGAISTIVAITAAKLLGKLPFFSIEAALAEQAAEEAAEGELKPVDEKVPAAKQEEPKSEGPTTTPENVSDKEEKQ